MSERTTVRLPEELLSRAKRRAAADGRTLTSLIEEGLRIVLRARRDRPKRVLPRISKATGGPAPGVDLSDMASLQEAEDLEYVRRFIRPE
jgi:hypothetical protein